MFRRRKLLRSGEEAAIGSHKIKQADRCKTSLVRNKKRKAHAVPVLHSKKERKTKNNMGQFFQSEHAPPFGSGGVARLF